MDHANSSISVGSGEPIRQSKAWHWAVVTSLLYALILLIVLVPLFAFAVGDKMDWSEIAWSGFLPWCGGIALVSGICQILLLIMPVRITQGRPLRRSSVWCPVIVSGLFFALIVSGFVCSMIELFKIKEGFASSMFLLLVPVSWIFWSIVFIRMCKNEDAGDVLSRMCGKMLGGSVLELLVAVPSHIIVRQRHECCAGILTFWGLVTGISVMLFSFGPAVFFLFRDRAHGMRRKAGGP